MCPLLSRLLPPCLSRTLLLLNNSPSSNNSSSSHRHRMLIIFFFSCSRVPCSPPRCNHSQLSSSLSSLSLNLSHKQSSHPSSLPRHHRSHRFSNSNSSSHSHKQWCHLRSPTPSTRLYSSSNNCKRLTWQACSSKWSRSNRQQQLAVHRLHAPPASRLSHNSSSNSNSNSLVHQAPQHLVRS